MKLKRGVYLTIGIIAFAVGTIGIILPVLPTTGFYLIASFCFSKGSKKFDEWFKSSGFYKKYLDSFVQTRSMTLKQKISILVLASAMICIPIILVDSIYLRLFLVLLIIAKIYYFTFNIKTIKTEKDNT